MVHSPLLVQISTASILSGDLILEEYINLCIHIQPSPVCHLSKSVFSIQFAAFWQNNPVSPIKLYRKHILTPQAEQCDCHHNTYYIIKCIRLSVSTICHNCKGPSKQGSQFVVLKGHIQLKYKLVLKWPIYYAVIASGFLFGIFSIFWNRHHTDLKFVLSYHQLLLLR